MQMESIGDLFIQSGHGVVSIGGGRGGSGSRRERIHSEYFILFDPPFTESLNPRVASE